MSDGRRRSSFMPQVVGIGITDLIMATTNTQLLYRFYGLLSQYKAAQRETYTHTRACARRTPLCTYDTAVVVLVTTFTLFLRCFIVIILFLRLSRSLNYFPCFFGRSFFSNFNAYFFVFIHFSRFCRFLTFSPRVSSCFYDCSYATSQCAYRYGVVEGGAGKHRLHVRF